ncbi:helix-turn-helix domain-containing protein [Glycomyces sp. L485]|uniref:helix-turn-helix domain-containing protein n=1 Tax=Glycomyces sp. L485 TaxID=2909235 RepID=UPI001F4B0FC2|nr:helix-turn-helix domain-containing protein [Glycomyces sp. L485]
MSTRAVAENMTELGRPMAATAITKIEAGGRRVDVDDLVALALAVGVSPVTLLMPVKPDDDDDEAIWLNEKVGAPWDLVWRWMHGEQAITGGVGSYQDFIAENRPYEKEIRAELARFLASRGLERPYVVTAHGTKAGPIEVEVHLGKEGE